MKKARYWASPGALIVFLYILTFQSFLKKLSIHDQVPFLDIWDELLVVAMLPSVIFISIRFFKQRKGKFFFFFLALYLLISISSSLFGSTTFLQSVYQLTLDSKYVVVFLFCLGSYKPGISEDSFGKFIKIIIIFSTPLLVMQFFFQSNYDILFPNGAHSGVFLLSDGTQLSRAAGVFWFTGILASFGVSAAAFFFLRVKDRSVGIEGKIFLFLSLLLLVSTLSRGEITGFIIGLMVVYFYFYTNHTTKSLVIIVILAGVPFAYNTFEVYFHKAFIELGLESTYDELSPRASMGLAAMKIAANYFPLGSGLGTFGGASAVKYDSSLFYEYHIAYEWYFERGLYLTDTYWPKVIAESGFFGAGIHLIFLLIPIFYFLKYSRVSFPVCYSLLMFVFLLVNSLSSPIYGSVFVVIISSFMLGGAISLDRNRFGAKS